MSWGYLGIALKKTREVEKSNCLRLSLKTYDSYLRKRLDVGVKDISLILPNNFLINKRLSNDTIESFRTSFEKEELGPLRYLVLLVGDKESSKLLTSEIARPFSEILRERSMACNSNPGSNTVLQFILNPANK